jgi:N-acetylmuramoyl-L-alanine amidase
MSQKSDLLSTARWHLLNGAKMPWSTEVTAGLMEWLGEELGYAPPAAPAEPIAALPDPGDEPLVALCLGHGRDGDEGNVGYGGVSEEDYNLEILRAVAVRLEKLGIRTRSVTHYEGSGYSSAMRWLAEKGRREGWTAAVEFHFNAANRKARGHEVLHWEHSTRGIALATMILGSLSHAFPKQPNRGLKPRNHGDRGALFLSRLHCPSVIVEPFFGDQAADWALFSAWPERPGWWMPMCGGFRCSWSM